MSFKGLWGKIIPGIFTQKTIFQNAEEAKPYERIADDIYNNTRMYFSKDQIQMFDRFILRNNRRLVTFEQEDFIIKYLNYGHYKLTNNNTHNLSEEDIRVCEQFDAFLPKYVHKHFSIGLNGIEHTDIPVETILFALDTAEAGYDEGYWTIDL